MGFYRFGHCFRPNSTIKEVFISLHSYPHFRKHVYPQISSHTAACCDYRLHIGVQTAFPHIHMAYYIQLKYTFVMLPTVDIFLYRRRSSFNASDNQLKQKMRVASTTARLTATQGFLVPHPPSKSVFHARGVVQPDKLLLRSSRIPSNVPWRDR